MLEVDLIWDSESGQPDQLQVESFFEAVAAQLDSKDGFLAVRVVDEAAMRALNQQYREKDTVTDVLSFPSKFSSPEGGVHYGDLLVCWPRCVEQASEIGHPPECEFRFLLLHGFLHLLGYDHESDKGEMMVLQKQLKEDLHTFFVD